MVFFSDLPECCGFCLYFYFISFIGYAPGQTINVKVSVNNESSSAVTDLEVQLNKVGNEFYTLSDISQVFNVHLCYFMLQQITFFGRAEDAYHSESSTRTVNETIREKMIDGVNPGMEATAHVDLKVPAIPPTDFSTSNIVKVHYTIRVSKTDSRGFDVLFFFQLFSLFYSFIQIAGTIDSCCNSIDPLDLPITIGTIPILDNFDTINPVISGQPTSSQNGASPFPNVPYPPIPSVPTAPNVPTAPIETEDPATPTAPSPPIDFSDSKAYRFLFI